MMHAPALFSMPWIWPRRRLMSPIEIALVFLGRGYFDAHDGLEENRVGFLHRVLEREDAGHLEREFGRIHLVERAVDDANDRYRPPGTQRRLRCWLPSRIPSVAGLMNSFGIEPPTVSLMTSTPLPFSLGSSLMTTWPYWPLPPDWRMNLPSPSAGLGDGLAVGNLRACRRSPRP